LRIGLYTALAAGVLVAIGLTGLRRHAVEQRKRAEVLQQQVLALEPGKSTLQDVRDLVTKYGNPGDYEGPCGASECHVSVALFILPSSYHFDTKLGRALGIRIGSYGAIIDVLNGVVSRADFYVTYRTTSGSWLSGSSHVINEFSDADRCSNPGLRRHSEYALLLESMSVPSGGSSLSVGVTPKVTANERLRAQTINLTCVTRLRSCTLSDLLPLAYSDWIADSEWERNNQQWLAAEQSRCASGSSPSPIQRPPWWSAGWRQKPVP
jgi:hypothetical protein